jgi:hypothetical protein
LLRLIPSMLIDHPHGTVVELKRKLVPCSAHHSSFSQIGASGKPGTLQTAISQRLPDRAEGDICAEIFNQIRAARARKGYVCF